MHFQQPLVLVFGVQLAGLFEHPTVSVSVIRWFVGGAVNLARAVEYAVQTGRTGIIILEWPLPLAGLRATKPGVDYRIFGVFTMFAALVFVGRGLPLLSPASDVPGLLLCCCYGPTSNLRPRKSGP